MPKTETDPLADVVRLACDCTWKEWAGGPTPAAGSALVYWHYLDRHGVGHHVAEAPDGRRLDAMLRHTVTPAHLAAVAAEQERARQEDADLSRLKFLRTKSERSELTAEERSELDAMLARFGPM